MQFRTEEDYRTELLIWILIGAFAPTGSIDQLHFDSVANRYTRELKKRGVRIEIYFDLITERSSEVFDACARAMEYGILEMQRPGRTRAHITGSVEQFLRRPRHGEPSLTDNEIRLAKEAAQAAVEAFEWHKLDDDLREDDSPAATK